MDRREFGYATLASLAAARIGIANQPSPSAANSCIAFLADGIREAVTLHQRDGKTWVVSYDSTGNSSQWVQFTHAALNFSYPSHIHPHQNSTLPTGLELVGYETDLYATYTFDGSDQFHDLGGFVLRHLQSTFGPSVDPREWKCSTYEI